MQKRQLGSTGLEISFMGIGGIPLQRFDEKNAEEILLAAKEAGINFIDTARGYTRSEELIGKALKKAGRENFVVATKAQSRDREGMKREIALSMEKLDCGQIDLYQCHFVCKDEDLDKILGEGGAIEALEEAKREGVIRHVGVTSHNLGVALRAIETGRFETVQFPFNFIEEDGAKVFAAAKRRGMGTISMKPVGGGAIRNRGLSFRHIYSIGDSDCIIPGVDNAEQLRENAADIGDPPAPLTEEEKKRMEDEKKLLGREFCRRCDYCQPCPKGIPISVIFTAKAYYERYNLKDWAIMKYKACKANYLDCLKCGRCESKCPYGLPIRKMLEKTHELLGGK